MTHPQAHLEALVKLHAFLLTARFLHHAPVDAAFLPAKLGRRAELCDLAVGEHQHAVAVGDGPQPVCNGQGRGSRETPPHGKLYCSVRGGVQCSRGFVEHDEAGTAEHGAGDGHHLPLPRGEVLSTLLDLEAQQDSRSSGADPAASPFAAAVAALPLLRGGEEADAVERRARSRTQGAN
eukprot:CAMPEP_0175608948 /NCGR_PEP_ID=MMETSP0096-20121207/62010_1 /TAXON_ID=311494 /ORGANISM="Alexandrium monilatum, Strain CCMP3105" /LENGTH=178 /DNA_ID=CAMNT_0016913857 /DNA_START=6 /DNA_END=544 /DNA_ORIENTATION=-